MLNLIVLAFAGAALLAAVTPPGSPSTPAETVLATGLNFPEGPSLSKDGKTLYCVNVQTADISRIDVATGKLEKAWVTLPGKGRGNGSTLGPDGNLYVCDVGRKQIVRISTATGEVDTIIDHDPSGNPFLGPNGIVFAKDGSFYFTDPNGSSLKKPFGAVYRYDLKTATISMVASGLAFPNGLALSPDNKTLYVAETPRGNIDAFDLVSPPTGLAVNMRVFAHVGGKEGPDGMRVAHDGSVYAAIFGDAKIVKLNRKGEQIATYPLAAGANVTNLDLDEKNHRMFITETASNSMLIVKL